jgi:biotin carboxyl carrier protein
MSEAPLAMLARRADGRIELCSPGVGYFTCAAAAGRALVAGQGAGVLLTLGRARELLVPEGVAGAVHGPAPERVHAPVGYGTVLYVLDELSAGPRSAARESEANSTDGALVFRSPSTGRFWHRTTPGDPLLAQAGDVLEPGRAIGLIEVMKTFTLVHYSASGGLPQRARVKRVLAGDGAEVAERAPLFELEPV